LSEKEQRRANKQKVAEERRAKEQLEREQRRAEKLSAKARASILFSTPMLTPRLKGWIGCFAAPRGLVRYRVRRR
jgi:hypothetical protein